MTESKERILEILNSLQAVGFGNADFVDCVVDVKQREKADYEEDGFDFEYFEKEGAKDYYVTSEKAKMFEMIEFRNKFFDFSSEEDIVRDVRQQALEIFEKLKSVPLSEEEFNKLNSLVREMVFYQMLSNTLDLGIHMSNSNIAVVNSAGFRSHIGRASVPIFFNERFKWLLGNKDNADTKGFDVNDANNMLFNLVPDSFDETTSKDATEDAVNALMEKTDELYKHFEMLKEDCSKSLSKDGYVDAQKVIEMHNVWNEYVVAFTDVINKYQRMNIDKYINVAKEHRDQDMDGNTIYKVGDEVFTISKDNLVDDLAKFASALDAYEKGEKENSEDISFETIKPIEIADVSVPTEEKDEEFSPIEEPVVLETEPEMAQASASDEPAIENDNSLVDKYADFVLAQPGYEGVSREDVIKIIEANPERLEKFAEALENGMIKIPEKIEDVSNEPLESTQVETVDEPIVEETKFEEIPINDISGIDRYGYVADPTIISNDDSQFGDYASIPDGYSIPDMEEHRRGVR